jgi:hypothetical protein
MKMKLQLYRYIRPIIAYIVNIGGFGYLFLISVYPVPAQNKDMVLQAQGFILAIIALVDGYYFAASKDKSDQDQSKIFPKDPPNP